MNCSDFKHQLDEHIDDTHSAALRREADVHRATCPVCRATFDSLHALRSATAVLPREIAPARDLWPEIAAQLAAEGVVPGTSGGNEAVPFRPGVSSSFRRRVLPLAVAASVAVTAAVFWLRPAASPGWTVAAVSGAPRVDREVVIGQGRWAIGQWLETDATSRAQFDVGTIGEVKLEPNSRLRLLGTEPTEHRIELAHGTMHALIWAPPRLFFVETPSATAIDLGCAYTLTVDARGVGRLEVTSGYVALEHGDRSALVPAGMICLTHPMIGPGTPFATTASPEFRFALDQFDSGVGGGAALETILAQARADDAVTLWHLLARASDEQRGAVFDKLAGFVPPPAGLTRTGVLAGEKIMLERWGVALGLSPVVVDRRKK